MRALGLAGNYSAAGAFLNASVYATTLGAYGQASCSSGGKINDSPPPPTHTHTPCAAGTGR